MPYNVAIVGAGPAGLTLALALAARRDDVKFTVFERGPSHLVAETFNPDRSYTIDITGHGANAARYVGVAGRFDKELIPFLGIDIRFNPLPRWLFDGKMPSQGWTGSRGDICRALQVELEARIQGTASTLRFLSSVTSVSVNTGSVTVTHTDGPTPRDLMYTFDLVVGADGGGSPVRAAMQLVVPGFAVVPSELPNHSRMLHLDQHTQDLDPRYLHVFAPPPTFLVAGAINGPGGPTDPKWFCQVGTVGPKTYANAGEARRHLAHACPALLRYVSDAAVADFARREALPTGKAKACSTFAAGRVVLLGDAAAPFPPVGQGVNAAMEAATVLDDCIGRAFRAAAQAAEDGDDNDNPLPAFKRPSPLQVGARLYDAEWRGEATAMRLIAQALDFRSSLLVTAKELVYQWVGCSALSNAKDGGMTYRAALRRQRALDVALAVVGVGAVAAGVVHVLARRRK